MTWRCWITATHDPHTVLDAWIDHVRHPSAECVGGPITLRQAVDEIMRNASAVEAEFGTGRAPTALDESRDVLVRLGFTDAEIDGADEIDDRGRFGSGPGGPS